MNINEHKIDNRLTKNGHEWQKWKEIDKNGNKLDKNGKKLDKNGNKLTKKW